MQLPLGGGWRLITPASKGIIARMPAPERTYKPELQPRRGEYIAWVSFVGMTAGVLILKLVNHTMIYWAVISAALLLLIGLAISLGNWMDRSSELTLREDGVSFTNGLRKASLNWDEIEKVVVYSTRWNKKVRVIGKQAYFDFSTLGDVKYQEQVQYQIGFSKGNEIMDEIIQKSGLTKMENSDGAYTYSRS